MRLISSEVVAEPDLDALQSIERRVLWLATSIVHHANHVRRTDDGMKVGGHQASSASMVSIMTALWFHALTSRDRVSVKPHAAPVLHAINYLLGELRPEQLTSLRDFGGLQSYPSRSKDPDTVDYSTGSVGIGATAPIWGAMTRRYIDDHFPGHDPKGRQYSLVGDAELDEGACWEAVLDPAVTTLGEVVWIVDLNRQSLDRVVPLVAAARMSAMFAAAGWQVITLKYGRALERTFATPGGSTLRSVIDRMDNGEYQRLLRCPPAELSKRVLAIDPCSDLAALVQRLGADEFARTFRNLAGHDLGALIEAFERIDDTRPTVVIAYTIKGYGLASEGHPQNHSNLLTEDELRDLATRSGAEVEEPWAMPPTGSPEEALCRRVAERLVRPPVRALQRVAVPVDIGRTPTGRVSTQQALGWMLLDLTREAPDVARRVVTVSPDVSSSTNLGGWVNKVGVWSSTEQPDWFADDKQTILHWEGRPLGQHIELGIAETNLVGLLAELGSSWSRWAEPLLPIGVVYDPFVARALEPWSFGIYAGGQSILVGTPSGVTLAREGGAHQSILTPSIGLEQPGCTSYEPAFAHEVNWCLLDALARLGSPSGTSTYLRLSTRPVDQALACLSDDAADRERRRRQVVAGGYLLRRHADPRVTIVATGAVIPESIAAAIELERLGVGSDVVCVTSADLLFRAAQSRRGLDTAPTWILDDALPPDRARPLVTVHDGHPHTLSFLPAINGVPGSHLGVSKFGQSGGLADVQRHHGIDRDTIVGACFDLLD